MEKANRAHHGFHTTVMEHHADGSLTIHHKHHDGEHKDVRHAAMNLDHAHDSMEDHLGVPNEGEDKDENHEALEEKLAPGLHAKMAEMGKAE